jgi:Spy/CpxP family protein refolding chaperone
MTVRKWSLAAAAVVLLGAMAVTAVADEHCDPFEGMGRLKRLLRGAELTQDQVSQIFQLRGASRAEDEQLAETLKSVRAQFDDKFTSTGQLDVGALTALHEEAEKIAAQRDKLGFEDMLKVRALLTPEQLARVDETHQRVESLDAELQSLEPTIAGESGK